MATEQNSGRPLFPSPAQGLPGEPPPWDEPPRPRSSWLYYAFAISLTAATLLTELALMAPSKDQPTAIVFLIPIALAAYFGGFGPGLVSTFLGLEAYAYFVASSAGGIGARHPVDYVRLAALLLVGVLISLLSESLHRSKERIAVSVRERQRSDEMLVESERRYRSLFENMSDGFAYCQMIFDEQGQPIDFVYIGANAAFAAQTGVEDVEGKKASEVFPGIAEAHPELIETYGRVSLTGRPERFEIEFSLLKSWFSVLAYSLRKEYFVIIFENITKRKESDRASRDNEEELKAIYDNMPLVMLLVDGERRVCKANKFAGQFAGASPDDLIGQRSGEGLNCVHSLDDPRGCGFGPDCGNCAVRLAVLDTVTTGRSYSQMETTLSVRAAEVERDVAILLSTTKLDVQGRPRVLVTMQDISEPKRAEALRVRSQKLEALGTLAGGIAHDFNNILAAINGNADLALSELTPDHPARECLTEIAKGGARAADLVRSILGFARPVEQKRKVQALLPVIEEAVKFVRATLPAGIEIRTGFDPDLPAVNADSTQIHQIIVNLATNAAHAIGDRPGHIDVRLDAVSVSSEQASNVSDLQEGRYVRLFVSDDGCGMDAATRTQMFDPFFTTKPPGQGTGLGLSVVHGIVSSYNGAIKAFSEPGEGTAFHLYFPAVEQAAEEPEAPRQDTQLAGGGRRIMYVDDEEALVFLATRKLEHMGYKVSGFTDAENALREFRLRPDEFDLVVTDVSMPRMSGLDLARELIAVRANIPIILTSGYVRAEDERKAEEIGIREFLLKPVTIDALTRTLGIVCRELAGTAQTGGGG